MFQGKQQGFDNKPTAMLAGPVWTIAKPLQPLEYQYTLSLAGTPIQCTEIKLLCCAWYHSFPLPI
jgi:hypothetical protein